MSAAEDFKKARESYVTTTVDVTPSELLMEVARCVKSECDRLVPYAEYKPVASLSVEDIHKYFSTLTWMRCQHVQDATSKIYLAYRNLYKIVEVPTFIYQLMISIGEVLDSDYAIRFQPVYSVDSKELLSVEQMKQVSDVFLDLRSLGFSSVTGMPNDREGELGFMACCHVKGVVTSYKDSHPVYGFLAAFFKQQELNEITGLMSRIIYGYDSDYILAVRGILSSLKAHQPAANPD
jgi:hypothetical protein